MFIKARHYLDFGFRLFLYCIFLYACDDNITTLVPLDMTQADEQSKSDADFVADLSFNEGINDGDEINGRDMHLVDTTADINLAEIAKVIGINSVSNIICWIYTLVSN